MVIKKLKKILNRTPSILAERLELSLYSNRYENTLNEMLRDGAYPRIAFVKQDVYDDLYCCSPGESVQGLLLSTVLRSGPIALFSKFHADFFIVETVPDQECNIWKEKWTDCKWCPVEWFEYYREQVPGRSYGQKDFSIPVEDIDWNQYDIVISADISVPERITKRYPSVAWCYYVREIRTSSYDYSREIPILGYDIFLNQMFRLGIDNQGNAEHEIDFPYHLHYVGCFAEIFDVHISDSHREGIFLEHHTGQNLSEGELSSLNTVAPIYGTSLKPIRRTDDGTHPIPNKTMSPEFVNKLLSSKYFVKCGGRGVLGTAMVEAIAAGCLAVGLSKKQGHNFILTKNTSGSTLDEICKKLSLLESNKALYRRELKRQRQLVDYLCYQRPLIEIFRKAKQVIAQR